MALGGISVLWGGIVWPSLQKKTNKIENRNMYIYIFFGAKKIVATKPIPTSPGETQLVSRIYLTAKDDINHSQKSPFYLTRKLIYTLSKKNI